MNITITPGKLGGGVTPPPSKSQSHRVIIAAALSDGPCRVEGLALSQDIRATLRCMCALGAECSGDGSLIRGAGRKDGTEAPASPVMDCGESGSTLRFLIPVALALQGRGVFTGHGRLMDRPQGPYEALFAEKGLFWHREGDTLTVAGELRPGLYTLPGDVSSQFVTGLLYALPLLDGDSELRLTTALEGRGYVDLTLEAMGAFGVRVEWDGGRVFRIPGGQHYRHRDCTLEADWSQAAFWYAACGMGNPVEVQNMDPNSAQGDRIIARWGEALDQKPRSLDLDVSQAPDLVPPLAVWGAVGEGTVVLSNAARLRYKESDRLAAVTQVLNALGARVQEEADRLVIRGVPALAGGCTVDCHGDHRIAMMAAIAATCCGKPVKLLGAECVSKSYPDFWEVYEALGGQIVREEA